MSFLWLLPTATLVVGAIAAGRMVIDVRRIAAMAEVELAEAAEALAVVGEFRPDLDEASHRIEVLVAAVGSPFRAVTQARRTARHWWSRARRPSGFPHVRSQS